MSAFYRSPRSETVDRARGKAVVFVHFDREFEIATLLREQDIFQCDDPCPGHPSGHYPIRSAGDIVCAHWPCGKVFLR
jgi:hypothetical protein